MPMPELALKSPRQASPQSKAEQRMRGTRSEECREQLGVDT